MATEYLGEVIPDEPDGGAKPYTGEVIPDEAPPATTKDRILAAEGGVNRLTVAGTLGLPVDTITNAINLAIAGYETLSPERRKMRELTGQAPTEPIEKPFLGSEHIAEIMDKLGFQTTNPRPDDPASRALYTGAGVAAGGLPFGSKQALLSGGGAALAREVGGDEWTGVGAMTPGSMLEVARNAKAATASRTNARSRDFWATGATPSVGQATGSHFFQGLENLAAKFPGGAGVMDAFRKNQQAKLGASASTGVSAEDAGRAIERGVEKFVGKTKATFIDLDKGLAERMAGAKVTKPSNTVAALEELTKPVATAEASTGTPLDARVLKIKDDLETDLAGKPPEKTINIAGPGGETISSVPVGGKPSDGLSFDALRVIRSRVGSQLQDSILVQGAKSGEMDLIYKALTNDMREAIKAQDRANGFVPQKREPTKKNPATETSGPIEQEFNRRNEYYEARMARIEGVLEKVIGKDKLPEDIFKSFMPTDRDAANKVRAVMRSLEPGERQVVTEAVINRLGRATPGKQNEIGDVFSSETFLTNWSRLSPGAKAQLFESEKTRTAMDALSKTASDIRDGGKAFANTSGTAGSFAAYELYSAPIKAAAALGGAGAVGGAVVAGGVPAALGIIGGALSAAGIANLGSKALTNPGLIEWLAAAPKIKPQNMPAHLARLGVIYNESDDETKSELDKFMKSLSPQEPDWDKKGKLPPFTGGPLKGPGVGVPVQPYAMATRS